MGSSLCGEQQKQEQEVITHASQILELDFNKHSTYKQVEEFSIKLCEEKGVSIINEQVVSQILSLGQFHLIERIDGFQTTFQKEQYLDRLKYLMVKLEMLNSIYNNYKNETESIMQVPSVVEPVDFQYSMQNMSFNEYSTLFSRGLSLISKKQVCLVFMCGGNSLRFGGGVKSTINIGLPSGSNIIEIIGRRLQALKDIAFSKAGNVSKSFQIIVITNHSNNEIIQYQWHKNAYFGFQKFDVVFIPQKPQYPITNTEGKIVLENKGQFLQMPFGSGESLMKIVEQKILIKLQARRIKYIHFIGVDNLLVKPLDPVFIGLADRDQKEISQKCVRLATNDEIFLKIAKVNGVTTLIDPLQCSHLTNGNLKNEEIIKKSPCLINSTILSLNFLNRLFKNQENKFVFNTKFRASRRFISAGIHDSTPQEVLIFEKHLSDLLEHSNSPAILEVFESEEFAPIIYRAGQYSMQDAIQKQSDLHKCWLNIDREQIKSDEIIEINTRLTYGGERLEQVNKELEQNLKNATFPLFINLQSLSIKLGNSQIKKPVNNEQMTEYHSQSLDEEFNEEKIINQSFSNLKEAQKSLNNQQNTLQTSQNIDNNQAL